MELTIDEFVELQFTKQPSELLVGVGDVVVVLQLTRHSERLLDCVWEVVGEEDSKDHVVVSQFTRQPADVLVARDTAWEPVIIGALELTTFNDGTAPAILYKSALLTFKGFRRLGAAEVLTFKIELELRGATVEAIDDPVTDAVLRKVSMLESSVAFVATVEAAITP